MSTSLVGLALRPSERRFAFVLFYVWSIPWIVYRLREFRRRAKQRRELEQEIVRLRELNQQLEASVGRRAQP